jgi:hypothetical protein
MWQPMFIFAFGRIHIRQYFHCAQSNPYTGQLRSFFCFGINKFIPVPM